MSSANSQERPGLPAAHAFPESAVIVDFLAVIVDFLNVSQKLPGFAGADRLRRVAVGSGTTSPPAGGKAAAPPATWPSLPPQKAFVVQFTVDSEPAAGVFAGRVEHLATGVRLRFASPGTLLDCLRRLLGESGE